MVDVESVAGDRAIRIARNCTADEMLTMKPAWLVEKYERPANELCCAPFQTAWNGFS
jgi:hypothetical protein